MPKIYIDIRDDIVLEDAIRRVAHVIGEGRVSKNNTMYCFLTTWTDGIAVSTREHRKNDCFVVWKHEKSSTAD
jgi:hypothetical protein